MQNGSPKLSERNSSAVLAQKFIADRIGTTWQRVTLTDRETALCAAFDALFALWYSDRDRLSKRIDSLERAQPYRAKTIIDPEWKGGDAA